MATPAQLHELTIIWEQAKHQHADDPTWEVSFLLLSKAQQKAALRAAVTARRAALQALRDRIDAQAANDKADQDARLATFDTILSGSDV